MQDFEIWDLSLTIWSSDYNILPPAVISLNQYQSPENICTLQTGMVHMVAGYHVRWQNIVLVKLLVWWKPANAQHVVL